MNEKAMDVLGSALERLHPYKGWTFFQEWLPNSLFLYTNHARRIYVYCTPDFEVDGEILVQVCDGDGDLLIDLDGKDGRLPCSIPFAENRTAERFFALLKPYLDEVEKLVLS